MTVCASRLRPVASVAVRVRVLVALVSMMDVTQ